MLQNRGFEHLWPEKKPPDSISEPPSPGRRQEKVVSEGPKTQEVQETGIHKVQPSEKASSRTSSLLQKPNSAHTPKALKETFRLSRKP